MNNNIYNILSNFNKVAQEPAQTETQPKAKTQLQESMEQVLTKKLAEAKKDTAFGKDMTKDLVKGIEKASGGKETAKRDAKGTLQLVKKTAKKSDVSESASNGIEFNGKMVDPNTLMVSGVDSSDYPDFSDAYLDSAEYTDGTPLSDEELDQFLDEHPDVVHLAAHDSLNDLAEGRITTDSGSAVVDDNGVSFNNSGYRQKFSWQELDAMNRGKRVRGFYRDHDHPYADEGLYVYASGDEEHHLPASAFSKRAKSSPNLSESAMAEVAPPGFPKDLYKKIKSRYKDKPEAAYATMWKIHKQMKEEIQRIAEAKKTDKGSQKPYPALYNPKTGKTRPHPADKSGAAQDKKISESESAEVCVYADGKKVKTFANRKLAQAFINHHKEHNKQFAGKKLTIKEGKKPDYIDLDKDGNKTEPMKKAAKDAKKVSEETRVHKGKYGTEYQGDADDEDSDGKKIKKDKPAKAEKRGRGRPKKGADNTGTVKKYSGDALSKAMGGGEKPKSKAKPSAVHKMSSESLSRVNRMVAESFDADAEAKGLTYEQDQLKNALGDQLYDELMSSMENGAELSDAVYDKLYDYYATETNEMPYGTQKARDGDPMEWIMQKLETIFPYSGDRRPEDYAAEGDMEEGNAFSGAVAKAKADGIQPGETITVGGKEYPVKEDDELNQMRRIAGLPVNECGMSPVPMQQSQQASNMNISTNMSSNGEKSVTVTATGDAASDLVQMLKLAGMKSQQASEPQVAVATVEPEEGMAEEKDPRYEANTTPEETVLPTQSLTKGGDGDVAGEEKDMDPDGSSRFSDNPLAVKKVKEEIDSLENMGLNLLRDYNSIKKVTK